MENTLSMEGFEHYAKETMIKHQIPGIGVGLNQDGQRVYEKGFGYRNIEKELSVTGDTVFGVASITKSFTCVAIMQLQEVGKLSVHDKIIKYLPAFRTQNPERTEQITIHHFMTHTSGLPPLSSLDLAFRHGMNNKHSEADYSALSKEEDAQESINTYDELMEYIGNAEFESLGPPGIHFSYSNDAFALLGAIIECVSGMSYEAYVREYILQPAGMLHSSFELNELDDTKAITMPYVMKEKDGEKHVCADPLWWDAPAMRAAGFLKSTTNDLLRYTEIYRNKGVVGTKRILSNESIEQMMYPYVNISPNKYYGYGLMITPDYYGNKLITHSGSLESVTSLMCIVPEKGITGVILTNFSGVPVHDLLLGAMNNLQHKEVHNPYVHYKDVDMSIEKLQRLIGTYASNEGMKLTITLEEDKLRFYYDEAYHPIRCIGEGLFLATIGEEETMVRFITNKFGHVDRVSFQLRQLLKIKDKSIVG